jgi:hypothetical protein
VSKLFRGCRYEVLVHAPNESLWSRHSSLKAARKAYREAINNHRGDHAAGTTRRERSSSWSTSSTARHWSSSAM